MLQSDSERKEHFYRDAYAIYETLLLPYSFPGMMRWKTEDPDLIKSVYQQLVKKWRTIRPSRAGNAGSSRLYPKARNFRRNFSN